MKNMIIHRTQTAHEKNKIGYHLQIACRAAVLRDASTPYQVLVSDLAETHQREIPMDNLPARKYPNPRTGH